MLDTSNGNIPRDRIEIDWDKVKELCKLHCTMKEIAAVLDISVDTLERGIKKEFGIMHKPSQLIEQWTLEGNPSLRRAQYEKAVEKGDTTMLIWLGKQYLNQTDRIEETTFITPIFGGEDELED